MPGSAEDTTGGAGVQGLDLGETSGTAGSGSAGNTKANGQGSGTPPNGSGAGNVDAADWVNSITDAGLKTLATQKGWKTADDVVKSYQNLEVEFSKKGAAPTPPANPTDYKFNVPADLPKEAGYNDAFAEWFKGAAHKAGLPQEMAAGIHDAFVEFAKTNYATGVQAQSEAMTKVISDSLGALTQEWGDTDSPGFKRNLELAKRAIRLVDPGLKDALTQVGAIVKVNGREMVANSTIFKALSKIGAGMYSEDKLHGEIGTEKNPFDDKTTDMAMQGRIIRENPDQAATLIRAAGKEKMFAQFLQRVAQKRK